MLHVVGAPGRGTPVVLLHHGAGSTAAWTRLAPQVAGERPWLAYDRRGFGRSPRTTRYGPGLLDRDVEDLAVLLARTGPAHLVGHSDGGSVALMAAARHPALVCSVVAVACHLHADTQTVQALRAAGPPTGWDPAVRQAYAREHGPDWAEVVGAWHRLWTAGELDGWDLREEVAAIECPVLVLHDEADPLSPPEHAEALAARLPGARVCWFATGSHAPHRREPERFVREVGSFLSHLP